MASKNRTQRKWEKKKRALERGDLEISHRNMVVLEMIQTCKAVTFQDRKKEEKRQACRRKKWGQD